MTEANVGNSAESFEKNRYIVARGLFPPALMQVATQYTLMKARTGQVALNDPQSLNTASVYADTLTETLLLMVTPSIEKLTGKQLYPTYSCFRVYRTGDDLKPHIDRPSSEIGVTVCLGFDISNVEDPDYRWKIYMDNSRDYRRQEILARMAAGPSEGVGIDLNPGDCAIYHGCEVRHWRDRFRGVTQSQAFLMFVDRNGPYAQYRYDTRPHLGFPADTITHKGPQPFFPDEQQ